MRGGRRSRILLAALVCLCGGVVMVGPWPTYGPVDLERDDDARRAAAALAASVVRSPAPPGRFHAGWARREMELPAGTPLAGYGAREGRPSTGARDALDVEALVVSDGSDLAALVASDLLIVPPNVAEIVRARVAATTPLRPAALLLNASHTHSGPGGFAPTWVARRFAGEHDPAVVEAIADAFVGALEDAHRALAPARLGHASVQAPELIRNRVRPSAPVDAELQALLVRREDGARLIAVCYAAHATLLPPGNTELDGGYPARLEEALERRSGADAFFLAGAVGAMGPAPPEVGDARARARAMGEALAARAVAALEGVELRERVDVAAAGAPFRMPPLQLRLNRKLRLSPLLLRRLGIDNRAWLSALRFGDLVLVGAPGDLSGEIAPGWKRHAAAQGIALWTLSFNGAYVGYLSPDRHYASAARGGREGYEMYMMSWCGPQQEELLTRLVQLALRELASPRQR